MRKLLVILVTLLIMCILTSCNYAVMDTKFQFDYAIIRLPNGTVIEGKIIQWKDYEGEQLQLVLEDGNTYLVNSCYTTLISYGEENVSG